MKKNEIEIHGADRQISNFGKSVLSELRKSWGAIEIEREVVMMCDESGDPVWGKEKVLIQSPNRRLNKGVERERFYEFAEMIKTEEEERNINSIIKAGCFEVEKAIAAFQTGAQIATDIKIIPKSFEDGIKLGAPSLSTLVKYKGEGKAADLIFMMTVNFARKFGKRNDLSESDILELSAMIVHDKELRILTISDIKMIFTRALFISKKMFNLDYAGVLELLKDCKDERMEWAMNKQIEEHRQMTSIEKGRRDKREVKLSGEGLSMEEMKREIKLQEDNKNRKI